MHTELGIMDVLRNGFFLFSLAVLLKGGLSAAEQNSCDLGAQWKRMDPVEGWLLHISLN